MLDVALGTACSPALGTIVHANDPTCRNPTRVPPRVVVVCSLTVAGLSAVALSSDPQTVGPFSFALARCASGDCAGGSDSGGSSVEPVVTAANVVISNVVDPFVSIDGGGGARRAQGGLEDSRGTEAPPARAPSGGGRRLRSGAAAAGGGGSPGLTFSRPGGVGVAQPMSINPAAAAPADGAPPPRTPRRLDWYAESLASSYVPSTPPLEGVPVTTRDDAAGGLGIGASQVRAPAPRPAASAVDTLTLAPPPRSLT